MEISVQYLGDVAFEASTRGHSLRCDQPTTNHGNDSGMTPVELLLASIGTCAGFYAAQYLRTRDLPTEGLGVRVSAEKGGSPVRLARFRVEVSLPDLDEHHTAGVRRAVESCLVHRTLLHTPEIEVALVPAAAEVVADQ